MFFAVKATTPVGVFSRILHGTENVCGLRMKRYLRPASNRRAFRERGRFAQCRNEACLGGFGHRIRIASLLRLVLPAPSWRGMPIRPKQVSTALALALRFTEWRSIGAERNLKFLSAERTPSRLTCKDLKKHLQ